MAVLRFSDVPTDAHRAEIRAIYREMGLEEGQTPPNFFTGMALRPDLLRAAWALTQSMYQGLLEPVMRELILTVVAAQNHAHYCCLSHAAQLKRLGLHLAQVESAVSDPDLVAIPEPTRAILRFAVKVATRPNELSSADFQELREAGLTNEALMEIVMLAAYSNWSNTWSSAADLVLD